MYMEFIISMGTWGKSNVTVTCTCVVYYLLSFRPPSLPPSLSPSLPLSLPPSLPLSLSLSLLPPFPPAPVSVTGLTLSFACLKQGQNLNLRCNINGFPRPRVTFSFGGDPITPGEGKYAGHIEETFYDEVSWKSSYTTSYPSRGQIPLLMTNVCVLSQCGGAAARWPVHGGLGPDGWCMGGQSV